jgi:hypothetical protein
MTAVRGRKRIARALAALAIGILAGLIIAETYVRAKGLGWDLVESTVYYQSVDLPNHEPVNDPDLLYRLKPGSRHEYPGSPNGPYSVSVNSLGARGTERPAAKPDGVFRIVCLGGSNVYGVNVNDDQTWPALLEQELNRAKPGRFEVWNLGTCAYVGRQMAKAGRLAAQALDPDLFIVALSNTGARPFLQSEDLSEIFKRNPDLWLEFFHPETLDLLPSISNSKRLFLLNNIALLRYALTSSSFSIQDHRPWDAASQEEQNIHDIREFLTKSPRDSEVAVFLCPARPICDPERHRRYFEGIDVPVLKLSAEDKPQEFRDVHPPQTVLSWYAGQVAQWLGEKGLLGSAKLPETNELP